MGFKIAILYQDGFIEKTILESKDLDDIGKWIVVVLSLRHVSTITIERVERG